jgi:hypothetical protein
MAMPLHHIMPKIQKLDSLKKVFHVRLVYFIISQRHVPSSYACSFQDDGAENEGVCGVRFEDNSYVAFSTSDVQPGEQVFYMMFRYQ